MGMEAKATVLDRSLPRLDELDWRYGAQLKTVYSTVDAVERHVADADLVIGSVFVTGAAAPKVVTEEMIKSMRPGSVVVDIAIDQGGCFETSRLTSHDNPVYTKHGVVYYCVTNMPGSVAQTSTFALNNATLPYTLQLVDQGWKKALLSDPGFSRVSTSTEVKLPKMPSRKPSAWITRRKKRTVLEGYPVHSDMNCAASGRRFSLTCLIGVPR